ncbi:MAG: hypothetical protein ABR541_08430 [Candidatus Dormibacteria bacterium]
MSALIGAHTRLGIALCVVLLGGAAWAVIAQLRHTGAAALRAYLVLCAGAVGLEAIVGVVLVATGHRPRSLIHWFYGGAALISLPIADGLCRRLPAREEGVIILGGAVAALLFAFRAVTTG